MKNNGKNVSVIISLLIVILSNIITQIISHFDLKRQAELTILIIITCISVLFGFAPLFYFFTIGGQKWIIEQFIPVVFNALFQERINTLKQNPNKNTHYLSKCIYRVSYYQYYDSKSWTLRFHRWKRFIIRWKYPEERRISKGKDVLLCKYRYGLENGIYTTIPSTIVYVIEENADLDKPLDKVKGVAGLIAKNNQTTFECTNNKNINGVIEILKNYANLGAMTDKENLTISQSVEYMKENLQSYQNNCKVDSSKPIIEETKQKELITFMEKTHTDYNAMFEISGGKHSNHFLGFKVYDELHNVRGVVVIDAQEEEDNVTFEQIVYGSNVTNWIENILQVFSGTTSKSMSTILQERDNENGKRIRD